jgi:diguanylate cyclase (GGDEF)-like protein/PAS domain S-box-containing protein
VSAIALIVLVGVIQRHFVRQDIVKLLSDSQFALATRVADELDSKMQLHLQSLAQAAAATPANVLQSPERIRAYYSARPDLLVMFDGILVLSAKGDVIADLPEIPGRSGVNAADRDYFQEALRTRQPLYADPVLGKATGEPIEQFVAPILGADRRVLAVLIGTLRLNKKNFLAGLSDAKVGKTGYFFVITKGPQPVFVVHPDRSRLMQARQPGASPMGDIALRGFEGTVEGVNSYGVPVLVSYKALKTTNWVLGAMIPEAEVFAPIAEAERRIYLVLAVVALLVAPLVWFITWRMLSPLTTLRNAIQNLLTGDRVFTPVQVLRHDEIGDLAANFNVMMADRDEVDARLRESEYRLRMITDNMPALIAYVDRGLRFRFTNKTYGDWFGYGPEQLVGRSVQDFVGPEIFSNIKPYLDEALKGERVTFSHVMHTPGKRRMVEVTLIPHCSQGGEAAGAYTLIHDITEQKTVEAKLRQLVRYDTLTQLPNRFSFNERLADAIARSERTRAQLALMFLDVDRFKAINDNFGHEAGDEVLQEFSQRVAQAVRTTDTVARLAGDEFVVILEGLRDASEAELVARKILAALEPEFRLRSGTLRVSTSIGIAYRGPGQVDAEELLRNADRALYVAKREGRNRYHVDAPGAPTLQTA